MRDAGVDLGLRLRGGVSPALRSEAKRLERMAGPATQLSAAQYAALAYPDRIGLRRPGDQPRYLLSGGTGAVMPEDDPLAGQRLIVACDLDGKGREARVRLALPIGEGELREVLGARIAWRDICEWSSKERRVVTRRREMLGAIALADRRWEDPPADRVAEAMTDAVRALGLPWSRPARRLQARIALLEELPDCSDAALMADLDWLTPYLIGITTAEGLAQLDLVPPLKARIGWDGQQKLEAAAPSHFETPLGRRVPIDYAQGVPAIEVRLQEMFGVTRHLSVVGTPLKVTLLSPAQRPVQVTTDLPSFWASSYQDVRKDMRGRYPRHPWPEDPTQADPTLRAKPRGSG
jgi:ATP-dependent helicase HrpB